ncbi:hypothetical protein HY498_05945 [Candidatus Woesearchaeota archaeon]|nr:hypothetical protein [Candidatus Woesearchaeota archaeon]
MAKAGVSNVALIGRWSFIIGLIVVILSGIPNFPSDIVKVVALVLGIVVGFLNITAIETGPFLIAVIALMMAVVNLNLNPGALGTILNNLLLFLSPASAIVAIKAIYVLARN